MQVRVSQGKYREFKCQRAELFTMGFEPFFPKIMSSLLNELDRSI